ncbi:hypothetical protein P389DRAFT_192359 [Cystobasidium minutum MCA 4210]|uniref:uncharacterized protein n=1 Tax=Cystobasidium minutum MCA 4210 TaxID=1397322 RepID=UPI0034CE5F6C|eukprot:jgi/Rhomi1/192359/gm1.573_g
MATLFQQPDGSESPLLPRELTMLISDCLEAPATFLIVQQVAQALKAKRKCVILGLYQSFDYYNAILRKQGIQLLSERERGNVAYIDVASMIPQPDIVKHLLENLKKHILEGTLLVMDDFSGLLHSGLPALGLLKLFRKMQALIRQSSSSLIAVYHDDAFSPGKAQISRLSDDAFLLRNIVQSCDIWLQTRSLRAQLTGEVRVVFVKSKLSYSPALHIGRCSSRAITAWTGKHDYALHRAAIAVQT